MKNMKKYIIILAAFFAAALLATGCEPEGNDLKTKAQGLTISLASGELETKAGEPFAFENAIEHFDFFFFKDAAGTEPIRGMHARVTGNSTTLDTSENGDYSALRKGTSYVYILANYPGTISHTNDWTLAQLLALEVDDPIVTAKETKLNPITGDMEETGKVTFCTSLVMDSYQKATDTTRETYTTKLTPQAIEEEREVTIKLSRLATKLGLIINVEPSVPGSMTYTDSQEHEHQEVWTPVLKDLHAYFVNALNNKTTVKGDPIERDTIAVNPTSYEYLTYPTLYPLTVDASNDHTFTSDPVYTYTQVWDDIDNGEPYFKIQIPWESSLRGSTTFYYKIALPKAESNKRTLNRNMFYQVTVDLAVVNTENEYVELNGSYVVTPWLNPGWVGGGVVNPAKFFSVPVTTFEVYSQDAISIPFYSSSATKAYFTNISYYYYGGGAGTQSVFVFTEADNKTSVTLHNSSTAGVPEAARDYNEYKLERDGNSWKVTHSLTGIYTARTIKFVIKNEDGESATVTVIQHPAIEIETKPAGNFFVNGHFARLTEGIHVPGHPEIKMGVRYQVKKAENGSYYYHSDDRTWTGDEASISSTNTYWFSGSNNYVSGDWGASPRVQRSRAYGRYGWVVGDALPYVPYMVKYTVSAFNESNNTYKYREATYSGGYVPGDLVGPKKFILGDPRVKGGSDFNELSNVSSSGNKGGYLYQSSSVRTPSASTGDAVYKAWQEPYNILMASKDANDGQVIAPRFLLSSYYNGQPGSLPIEESRLRAATYQEAGYPAGRWRLPTEAEIMFMVYCQQQGFAPTVFANGSNYWTADGRWVHIQSGSAEVLFLPAGGERVNRFVYDLWYWGDDPMTDQEQYWPNGHLAKPNDKTGSTFPAIN